MQFWGRNRAIPLYDPIPGRKPQAPPSPIVVDGELE